MSKEQCFDCEANVNKEDEYCKNCGANLMVQRARDVQKGWRNR